MNRGTDNVDKRLDLAVAIERLEPLDRAIVRYWLQGYTQREIGKLIGDPVEYTQPAVKYRLDNAFGLILDYVS